MVRLILRCEHFDNGQLVISDDDLPLSIGRSRRAGITIPDPQMSRTHSELRLNSAGFVEIVDLQSTNLTIVNDQDVEHAELKTGDRILLGDTEFTVEVHVIEQDLHERTTREIPIVRPADSDTGK